MAQFKKGVDAVYKYAGIPLSVAALGIGAANYSTNRKRQKTDKIYQKQQLEAMKGLTNTLSKVNSSMENVNTALNNNTTVMKNQSSFRMANPIQQPVNQTANPQRKKSLFGRLKLFSIEDGGYKGGKRSLNKTSVATSAVVGGGLGAGLGALIGHGEKSTGKGAAIFGLIGAGLGAFSAWMSNIADKSLFNSGRSSNANSYRIINYIEDMFRVDEGERTTTVTKTDPNSGGTVTNSTTIKNRKVTKPKGVVYDVDGDPRKYMLSILYSGNVMVMFLNKPNRNELKFFNNTLDEYCYSYKNADYTAETIGKDIYVVEVYVVDTTEEDIIGNIIDAGIKINIITGSRFGIKGR